MEGDGTDGAFIGGAFQEFEELDGMDNRVWDRRSLDEFLLNKFSPKVPVFGQPLRSHDGQSNIVLYTGLGFRGE